MEPLDPELRQLLERALPAAGPGEDERQRGLESLLAHLDPKPPLPSGIPAAAGTVGLTKLVLVVAAVAAVGTAIWLAGRPAPAPRSAASGFRTYAPSDPAAAPVPPNDLTSDPELPPVVHVPDTPVSRPTPPLQGTRSSPRREPTTESTRSIADALRAEANLIARAESALDRNKPREALALCDMHRIGFQAPQLSIERQAISASAVCMLDALDTRAARTFVRRHPRSALAKKVLKRCKLRDVEKKSTQP